MGRNCASCKYFNVLPEPQCRIRAPKVFLFQEVTAGKIETKMNAFFPQTRPESWCGEYDKDEATPGT